MKYCNSAPQTITMQALPEVTKSTALAALVGPDSWALLNLLNAYCSFLTKNPKCWEQNSCYIACKKTAQEINFVNDAS